DMRDRIFRSGFTTKSAGEGTGLGLNISKRIIEEIHHGSLDFESKPGEGTTFHIRIPIGAAIGE
ncbi:MAG: HAMP domain-containing histidine kinase, partial [Acidobacteriota bacterium]|nr:HAMP domain-containing histidine kinase [Acidobacteriota bacterium]